MQSNWATLVTCYGIFCERAMISMYMLIVKHIWLGSSEEILFKTYVASVDFSLRRDWDEERELLLSF